jgi:hypothetical protein
MLLIFDSKRAICEEFSTVRGGAFDPPNIPPGLLDVKIATLRMRNTWE